MPITRLGTVLTLVALGASACDTGDGRTLAPPPPTTAPLEAPSAPTVPAAADERRDLVAGELVVALDDGRSLEADVTLCRLDGPDLVTLTATGARDGVAHTITLQQDPLDGSIDLVISFPDGRLWRGEGHDGGEVVLLVTDGTGDPGSPDGVRVEAEARLAEQQPGRDGLSPVADATLAATCR